MMREMIDWIQQKCRPAKPVPGTAEVHRSIDRGADGTWDKVEPIISRTCKSVPVFVYDLP